MPKRILFGGKELWMNQSTSRVKRPLFWPKIDWTTRQDGTTPVLRDREELVMRLLHVFISAYPVPHIQNVHFIYSSVHASPAIVSIFSSKHYSTEEVNLCKREPCTGRGPGTSGLRGAPSGYNVCMCICMCVWQRERERERESFILLLLFF